VAVDYYTSRTAVGTFGSANGFATNELAVDMYGSTLEAYPALTPLTTILTKAETNPATNFRVDWQESGSIPDKVVVGAAVAAGGTSVTVVANGTTIPLNSHLFNPRTFDQAEVTVAPTTNTLTITRSEGGTTAAAWIAGDVLYVLPPAVAENDSETFRAASVADTNVYNLMQLIRMQFCIDRVANAVSTHFGGAGAKRHQLKMQKYHEFRRKWEILTYFGGRSSSGTAPATVRTAGGLTHYLRNGTLYKDFGGWMTHSGFRAWLGDYKDQNPDSTNIMFFAAGNVIDRVNDVALNQVRVSPESDTYGMDLQRYKARGLMVDMVPLPLLTDHTARGFGWILDMSRIRLRTLEGPMFYPEALNVGQSELIYDTYRVVTCLLVGNESRHSMCVGADL
jgi:hypothetical protein